VSKGLGRVELLILDELRQGDATVNDLSIAAAGMKAHVLYYPCNTPEYQSAARAMRSLISKGLVVRGGGNGAKQLYKKR
jgi:hypothetical protein